MANSIPHCCTIHYLLFTKTRRSCTRWKRYFQYSFILFLILTNVTIEKFKKVTYFFLHVLSKYNHHNNIIEETCRLEIYQTSIPLKAVNYLSILVLKLLSTYYLTICIILSGAENLLATQIFNYIYYS